MTRLARPWSITRDRGASRCGWHPPGRQAGLVEVIRFRPEAARELTADAQYYNKHYTGRGDGFAAAVERALLTIEQSPLARS